MNLFSNSRSEGSKLSVSKTKTPNFSTSSKPSPTKSFYSKIWNSLSMCSHSSVSAQNSHPNSSLQKRTKDFPSFKEDSKFYPSTENNSKIRGSLKVPAATTKIRSFLLGKPTNLLNRPLDSTKENDIFEAQSQNLHQLSPYHNIYPLFHHHPTLLLSPLRPTHFLWQLLPPPFTLLQHPLHLLIHVIHQNLSGHLLPIAVHFLLQFLQLQVDPSQTIPTLLNLLEIENITVS